jgi:transcriptional regulator with PAS, ATPase and Fis domain
MLLAENARLVAELRRANERLAQENRYLKEREAGAFAQIIGRSRAIQTVCERARKVAAKDSTVLITGPTGTGKELFARAIHHEGPRAKRLFVAVNCGALTESVLESELFGHRKGAFTGAVADKKGLFEVADGGTIFLDEIGEASLAFQVKLLRVLQEGEVLPVGATHPVRVNVRVIAATNRDLKEETAAGRFRLDLYYRLAVTILSIPPLAERREDIPLLVEHLLDRLTPRVGLPRREVTPAAMAALQAYDYPGNVRELANLIEGALLDAEGDDPITEAHLFERMPDVPTPVEAGPVTTGSFYEQIAASEREVLRRALERNGGNRTLTANELGMSREWLLKKLKKRGLK